MGEAIGSEDATFRTSCLLQTQGGSMLLHMRQIQHGMYMAKAIHFDQAMKYIIRAQSGSHDVVMITGASQGLLEVTQDYNIEIPVSLFKRFFKLTDDGLSCKVQISAESV